MPSVGTLNLTVESNASAVGSSLEDIAGALGRIKKAIPENGLGLPGIAEEIKTFVSTIKTIESSSTAFKSIESLGNGLVGIAKFLKYSTDSVKESTGGLNESISTINTQPAITAINQLKGAIGDGLKLGQSGTQLKNLKEALGGEWNTDNAEKAGSALKFIAEGASGLQGVSLGTQAKNISAMANAISEYANSVEELKVAATGGVGGTQTSQFAEVGGDAATGYAQGVRQGIDEVKSANSDMTMAGIESVQSTQESNSPSLVFMRLGVYAAEGYIEGVKSKMMDVAGTLADMTKTAIISAKDKAPEAAMQVAEAIRSTFKTVLSSDLVPDAVKAPLSEGVERIASFVQALVGSASKDQYAQAATMASAAVREGLSTAISESFGLLKSETGVQAVETEISGIFKQVETPIEHVNSELQETKQTVEGVTNAFKPAKAIIASTMEEFKKSEKEGTFASWMYGPRPEVPYTNMNGMLPGYQTDAEASAKNPQWYQPEEFYQRMAAAAQSAQQPVERLNEAVQQTMQGTATPDTTFVDNLISGASEVDLLKMKVEDLTAKLYDGVSAGTMTGDQIASTVSQIQTLNEKISDLVSEQERAESMAGRLSAAWGALGGAMQRLFPTISSMLKRFKQIVKYRLLRSVLRHITAGFSEGVKNVYEYSKAIGSSFATSMDDASTALLKMKNSIGAAAAPLIQALIPVLQTVVNWVINAVNWLNQFFALLTGQKTWTRAIDYASQAYGNNTKAAKNAAKAAKDLLADWDELNIIQSQGGNGGGGSGSTNTPDYSKMFEEVNQFSDSVKDAIKFIEDHLGGLGGLLAKLGAILLGWKFSKAFTGFLGTLGKLVAGGALIAIGLDLSYGTGFEAGAKGHWDTADIIRGIVGGLATAIGGSIITNALGLGGALGFGIGLTLAAVVTLVGWLKGQRDLQDKNKWGNLSMTREEIEKFVEGQFTFDVKSAITILDGIIQNEVDARRNLNEKITNFKTSLNKATVQAGIDIDSSETGQTVKDAYQDALDAIGAVETLMKTSNDGLSVLIKSFRLENSAGEDVTEDLMKDISIADTTLKEYFTGIGEQLAYWIGEGERNGYTADITKNALALMEREKKILEKAQEFTAELDFNTKLKSSMDKIIDRDTALEQKQYQEELLSEYRDKAEQEWQEQYKTAIEMAGIAQGAADDALEQAKKVQEAGDIDSYNAYMKQYNDMLASVETYQKKATAALNAIDQIDEQLAATKENMAKQWAETLKAVYGVDYDTQVKNALSGGFYDVDALEAILNPFGDSYSLNRENYLKHGIIDTANKLREKVYGWLLNPDSDYSGLNKHYLKDLGGNAFDLLTDEAKQNLIKQLYEITESTSDVEEILHQAFGLSYDKIEPFIFDIPIQPQPEIVEPDNKAADNDWGIFDIFRYHPPEEDVTVPVTVVPEVKVDKLADLKEEIEAAMSDGIMSTDEAFDLMIKYGTNEFDQAMKELQYNLDEEGRNRGTNLLNNLSRNPLRVSGAMGVSDVGWARPTYTEPEPVYGSGETSGTMPMQGEMEVEVDSSELIDYSQMSNSVKTGNADVVSELRSAVQVLQRILAKPWVVNVQPTSGLGRTVGQAAEAFGRATGDN